jgi:hypothetical protein
MSACSNRDVETMQESYSCYSRTLIRCAHTWALQARPGNNTLVENTKSS